MANKNKIFLLGILLMFITLAGGSRIQRDSEGFTTAAGSKPRRLDEAQKTNSSNLSESSSKDGKLVLGESQNKTKEGSGHARKEEAANNTEVSTPSRNNDTVIENGGHSNLSSENSTKGSKPEKVSHGGSQSSNDNSTGNGDPLKKEKPKTLKNDDLVAKKNESGSHPQQNSVPAQQKSVPAVDPKGSGDKTQSNDTVTDPPPKKGIGPPPVEDKNMNSTNTGSEKEEEKSGDKSDKDASNMDSKNGPDCDKAPRCTDNDKIVVACFRVSGNEMQELSLLIINKGEETLNVSIKAPDFLKIDPLDSTLEKHKGNPFQVSMVNSIPRNANLSKIVINSGHGECILDVPNQYVNHSYKQRLFDGFPYSDIVTPMFGVYLLIFTVLAIGASWIFCKLRGKRRHGDGIRYQELEMNNPESNLSTNGGKLEADSIDGWDEWDDTWEDAEAGRASTRPIQTVSSNGLASRRSNKDGWDNSWDD